MTCSIFRGYANRGQPRLNSAPRETRDFLYLFRVNFAFFALSLLNGFLDFAEAFFKRAKCKVRLLFVDQ